MSDTEYPDSGAGPHRPGVPVDLTKPPQPQENQNGFTVDLRKPKPVAAPQSPPPILTKPTAGQLPSQSSAAPSAGSPTMPIKARSGSRTWTMLAVAAVVGIVITALATYSSTRSDTTPGTSSASDDTDNGMGAPTAITPCATPPEARVQSVVMTGAGLGVTVNLSSPCGSGDVLTDQQLQLAVTDDTHDVAAGTFDTASDPVIIGPGGTATRTFVFTPGTYWQTPESLKAQGSRLSAVTRRSEAVGRSAVTAEGGSTTLTATGAAAPALGTADGAALDGLKALATADRPVVTSTLANRWVPQISSKRPGLVAEGLTWTAPDILGEHLGLRQRYPDTRLVWSGDWRTFNDPDWWVTIVGLPSNDSATTLSWCAAQGFDRDHCYAKIVSDTQGLEGTTALGK